tara:strand:+ start:1028 stop:1303 length:276 start_codon:yes stop_codon:yes gene_type:complete
MNTTEDAKLARKFLAAADKWNAACANLHAVTKNPTSTDLEKAEALDLWNNTSSPSKKRKAHAFCAADKVANSLGLNRCRSLEDMRATLAAA